MTFTASLIITCQSVISVTRSKLTPACQYLYDIKQLSIVLSLLTSKL